MPQPSELARLIARCKASVHVEANPHRASYETVAQYLRGGRFDEQDVAEIPTDVIERMLETDTVIELQFYPATPIGFYRVWHYDLDAAVAEAHRILDELEAARASPTA